MHRQRQYYILGNLILFVALNNFQAGSSCVPFWLSKSNVCSDIVVNSSSYRDAFNSLVFTDFLSYKAMFISTPAEKKCSRPCNKMTVSVNTRGIAKFKGYEGTTLILEFNPTYQLRSKVLAYDEFAFIVDTGSSLGLWIGEYLTYIGKAL